MLLHGVNYHSADFCKSCNSVTNSRRMAVRLIVNTQTQTQTQTESELFRMHAFKGLNSTVFFVEYFTNVVIRGK